MVNNNIGNKKIIKCYVRVYYVLYNISYFKFIILYYNVNFINRFLFEIFLSFCD